MDSEADTTETVSCAASSELLYFHDEERRSTSIGDVTGDGVAETANLQEDGDANILSLGADAGVLMGSDGYLVNVMAEDVNADGQFDLIVAQPWKSEVAVFFGPLRETVSWDAADVVFAAPTNGGLENLYGAGLVVGLLDDDSTVDVLVAAPAEGEEGCFGQEPPRLYLGPLQSGQYTRDDADVELDAPQQVCLGLRAECGEERVLLYGQRDAECSAYDLPLTDNAAPDDC
jgi:hypothetical protein